jgi:hypothetical protein
MEHFKRTLAVVLLSGPIIAITAAVLIAADPAPRRVGPLVSSTACRHNLTATWLDQPVDDYTVNQEAPPAIVRRYTSGFYTSDITEATLRANEWATVGFWRTPTERIPPSAVKRITIQTTCY